jgi:hypothetical protein
MSLLNLNISAGRGPRGKKSLKMFMGIGLLVAVLGIGSTLAANITLNSPEGTSEFGQGVTQTIYCGAEEGATVKVTPASAYTNSTATKSLTINTLTPSSSSGTTTSINPVTLYAFNSSNLPSLTLSTNTTSKVGWWYNSTSSGTTPMTTQPSFETVFAANSIGYYFVERASNGGYKTLGSSNTPGTLGIKISDELSNFKLGKVTISNIPAACSGVNFVLSSYGSSGTAQTLSAGYNPPITEVAVLWNGGNSPTYPSRNRTVFQNTKASSQCLVTTDQTSSSLTFSFTSPNISAAVLNKLVIETQEDAIGAGSCTNNS